MTQINHEDYENIGSVLKNLRAYTDELYTYLNKIHWIRQADQLLPFKTSLEQLSYSLEHKMSKDYPEEDTLKVFF